MPTVTCRSIATSTGNMSCSSFFSISSSSHLSHRLPENPSGKFTRIPLPIIVSAMSVLQMLTLYVPKIFDLGEAEHRCIPSRGGQERILACAGFLCSATAQPVSKISQSLMVLDRPLSNCGCLNQTQGTGNPRKQVLSSYNFCSFFDPYFWNSNSFSPCSLGYQKSRSQVCDLVVMGENKGGV